MNKIVISGKAVEHADVVWFNPQKGYGFAEVCSTKEQIFFHRGDGRQVDNQDGETIIFTSLGLLEDPRKDDRILFVRGKGKGKKPKASPWTSLDEYITIEAMVSYLNSVHDCGHKIKDHNGNDSVLECTFCNCGTEAWDHRNDDDEP